MEARMKRRMSEEFEQEVQTKEEMRLNDSYMMRNTT